MCLSQYWWCHLQDHSESLDGIIDTVSAEHPIAAELGLLKIDGKLIMVGVPPKVSTLLPVTCLSNGCMRALK